MIVRPNLIPGYTIVERLGTGGLSGVFRALRDGDGLEVALKVTSLADLDPEFRPQERFEREAELLARLSHPSLPRFHDWGVTLEGFGWIALELVRGVPLSHFALRPAWELIPILIPVAEALATVARRSRGAPPRAEATAPRREAAEARQRAPVPQRIDAAAARPGLQPCHAAASRHQ